MERSVFGLAEPDWPATVCPAVVLTAVLDMQVSVLVVFSRRALGFHSGDCQSGQRRICPFGALNKVPIAIV